MEVLVFHQVSRHGDACRWERIQDLCVEAPKIIGSIIRNFGVLNKGLHIE